MHRRPSRPAAGAIITLAFATVALAVIGVDAQARRATTAPAESTRLYGAKIKEYTPGPARHHGARRSSARLGHGAVAAQVASAAFPARPTR